MKGRRTLDRYCLRPAVRGPFSVPVKCNRIIAGAQPDHSQVFIDPAGIVTYKIDSGDSFRGQKCG